MSSICLKITCSSSHRCGEIMIMHGYESLILRIVPPHNGFPLSLMPRYNLPSDHHRLLARILYRRHAGGEVLHFDPIGLEIWVDGRVARDRAIDWCCWISCRLPSLFSVLASLGVPELREGANRADIVVGVPRKWREATS